MKMILTVDRKQYRLEKTDPSRMITGRHYLFYGISWYELIPITT